MEPWILWTVLIVYSLQCGIGCIVIAESKNRHPFGWFVYGLLFGIIGVY